MKCSYQICDHDVYRFEMPVIHANMYVMLDGNSALVIDPSVRGDAGQLLREAQISNCTIVLTHEHYDHISGVNHLRELFSCQVICSQACAERISSPHKNCAAYFNALFLGQNSQDQKRIAREIDTQYFCQSDITYTNRMEMQWRGLAISLTETPGHSPGSQIIEIENRWYFTGDSLIPGQNVITRLPGGNRKQYDSATRPYLGTIAHGSVIFPGHGRETAYIGRDELNVRGVSIISQERTSTLTR